MKNLGLVIGFLPLIVYAVLSGHTVENTEIAILAACVVSVIVGFRRLKRGSYLDWANILMFAGALIGVSVLHITILLNYMNLVIYLVLAVVAFGSLLAGNPFTLQYARDMVDKSLWDNPVFKSVNVFMTAVWGGLFVINLALDTYAQFGTGLTASIAGMGTYAVLVIGIVFSILYPRYIQKKARAAGARN